MGGGILGLVEGVIVVASVSRWMWMSEAGAGGFWGSDDGATAAPFFTVLRVPAQSRSGGRGRPRGRRRQRRSGRGRRSR